MRIGIFVDAYEPYISGVTTSIKMLVETYRMMGHEVFIVTANLNDGSFNYDQKKQTIYLPGVKAFGLYEIRLSGFYSIRALKIIKSWNLDVIHSHTEFGVGTFARIVRKQLDIPLVHTYHTQYEDYLHYITKGLFNGFSKKIVAGLTKIYGDKTLDGLIVPTKKIKDLFVKKYHINRKIYVIPSGINTESFIIDDIKREKIIKLKKKYHIQEDDFVIGSVSRIAKEKSLDYIINQMPALVSEYPNIKLLFIGDGPEMKSLKKLVSNLELNKNIIFIGQLPYEKLNTYYHLMNVFVTASRTETQGLTVVEALAAGKPVVCVDDPSFKLTVVDEYNGYLFNKEVDYIKHIKTLLTNKKIYDTMSKNATNSVYRYSKEAYAAEVLKVYAETISECNKKES